MNPHASPRTTDYARTLLRKAQIALAALAAVIAVAVGLAAGATAASPPAGQLDPLLTGVLAGAGTLAICWTLLAVACAVWRSRLAARDSADWAGGWARFGPAWSRSTD